MGAFKSGVQCGIWLLAFSACGQVSPTGQHEQANRIARLPAEGGPRKPAQSRSGSGESARGATALGSSSSGANDNGTRLSLDVKSSHVECAEDRLGPAGVLGVAGTLTTTGSVDSAELSASVDGRPGRVVGTVPPRAFSHDGRSKTASFGVQVRVESGRHQVRLCATQSGAQGREPKQVCAEVLEVVVECGRDPGRGGQDGGACSRDGGAGGESSGGRAPHDAGVSEPGRDDGAHGGQGHDDQGEGEEGGGRGNGGTCGVGDGGTGVGTGVGTGLGTPDAGTVGTTKGADAGPPACTLADCDPLSPCWGTAACDSCRPCLDVGCLYEACDAPGCAAVCRAI